MVGCERARRLDADQLDLRTRKAGQLEARENHPGAAAIDARVFVSEHDLQLQLRIELLERAQGLVLRMLAREDREHGAWLFASRCPDGRVVDRDPPAARVADHDYGHMRLSEPRRRLAQSGIDVRVRVRGSADLVAGIDDVTALSGEVLEPGDVILRRL